MSWRALVVAAHPDDIEFSCAGTVARWVSEGAEVTYCVVTDGSTGTQDRAMMGEPLARLRREESQRAAAAVGVSELAWLGYQDGYVLDDLGLRRDIARVFRRYRPHRFVVMDPGSTFGDRFINHPDHRAVGQASLDVTLTAGTTPGHFPELLEEDLEPWRGLREVWIAGPGTYPAAIDISEFVEAKIDALLCHKSQVGEDVQGISERIRQWTSELGAAHGLAHAETFKVIAQGPGFHPDEQLEDAGPDLARAPQDPRAAGMKPSE
ncbi:MAG: PIG-L family deacetylase [Actinomycetota bacterium]|nr:PIG-L family deacetylase [Actinomycetota bacterium]